MAEFSRRETMGALAATSVAAAPGVLRAGEARYDVIVVGAGVFGAWTAERLRAAGTHVLLLDAWAPGHARASSGGESRMTRGAYGKDKIYTRMAWDSLPDWAALSRAAELPLFHKTGVLFFFSREEPYAADSLAAHKALGLPIERIEAAALRDRWPQVDWSGVSFGIFEPEFGALMARRAVETLVERFRKGGGAYRRAAVLPPGEPERLEGVRTATGETLTADRFVFACGPWMPKLFPALLGKRIFPTRQEVFYFATAAGDDSYGPARLPGWADFNGGDIYYGFPDLEGRGFKLAHDAHGPAMDPDQGDRLPSLQAMAEVRMYMERRFPRLAKAALNEARVCQYENSANGDFLIDRHPEWANVVLVGGGSGHGFKHGPAVGTRAAGLVLGRSEVEPRFSLASKGTVQDRSVH
jgi:monomeric sarcosine oxidase